MSHSESGTNFLLCGFFFGVTDNGISLLDDLAMKWPQCHNVIPHKRTHSHLGICAYWINTDTVGDVLSDLDTMQSRLLKGLIH